MKSVSWVWINRLSVIRTFIRVCLMPQYRMPSRYYSGHFPAVVPEVAPGSGTDGWGGALLVGSACTRRLLSAGEIPCDRKGSSVCSLAPILGGIVSLGPSCSACGEGSICRISGGRGSSLTGGPISRSDIVLARSSTLGAIAVEALLSWGSWCTSCFCVPSDLASVLGEKDEPCCSTPARLLGEDSRFNLPWPDLRGGGYVSPRASAAALRRSVSALLGRPRFLGGSPKTGFSKLEDKRAEVPLSLLKEAALAGGRG